jgi:N-acetylneuraminic acid mutarotase
MNSPWIALSTRLAAATLALALTPAPLFAQTTKPTKPPSNVAATVVPIPLPAARHGHRIEKVGGGLLCFGGYGDASAPNRESEQTWWLAPGAKTWRRRTDMAVGRGFFGSAVVGDVVYAIGDGVERYDLPNDRWRRLKPDERLPRSHFAAAAVGSTVYILGGYGGETDKLWAIEHPSEKLRALPPPPGFKRDDHFHFLHAFGGKLHVIGGLDGKSFTPKAEHWVLTNPLATPESPSAKCWTAQARLPVAVWAKFAVQAVADGKLYLFGDFGAFRFDSTKKEWTPRAKLPFMIAMPQAVSHAGSIWVIGGEHVAQQRPRERILLQYVVARDAWIDHSR